MKRERENIQSDDVAEIWRTAQLRRTHELRSWMRKLFGRRPRADGSEPIFSPLPHMLTTFGRSVFRSLVSQSKAMSDVSSTKL
jgi:hypothetical protein